MAYDPDIFVIQTLTGFKRVSLERFNKIDFDCAKANFVNPNRDYDLHFYVKPSLPFYILNKNKGEDMWQLLCDKLLNWFNKKSYEIGFSNVLIEKGE